MAKRSSAAKAPDLAAIAAAAEPVPPPPELGPSVTDEFADALGLSELKGSRAQRVDGDARPAGVSQTPPAATPPPIHVDWAAMVEQQLGLLDKVVSKVLGVESETPEDLKQPAQAMTPWIVVHMQDAQSETAMRLLALSGLITYVAVKVLRWAELRKKQAAERKAKQLATAPDEPDLEPASQP